MVIQKKGLDYFSKHILCSIQVNQNDLDRAVECLSPHFTIFREREDGELIPVKLEGAKGLLPQLPLELS